MIDCISQITYHQGRNKKISNDEVKECKIKVVFLGCTRNIEIKDNNQFERRTFRFMFS